MRDKESILISSDKSSVPVFYQHRTAPLRYKYQNAKRFSKVIVWIKSPAYSVCFRPYVVISVL